MQVQKKNVSETKIQLSITADENMLQEVKALVLRRLARQVKTPGFRQGKAPISLIEKQVDQTVLQSEFLDEAVNKLYVDALQLERVRPVDRPEVNIKKFVPFATLEVEATVEAVGEIKLPDYKTIKVEKKSAKITAKQVDEVIESLRERTAKRNEITRAAKAGDEIVIDFAGVDTKTKEPINGADGKGYPLILGSNTFIPGFEDNLTGMKVGEEKSFAITFPADYGVKTLQNRNVTFTVTATKVHEIVKPKVDDEFAATVGPVKTVEDLKVDVKKQMEAEQKQQAEHDFESEILEKITDKAEVAIPKVLVDEEIARVELDEKQNLVYRGQTWEEHLKEEGVTEEEHFEQKRPGAEKNVKAGLILTEIADKEGIIVTPEELEVRLQLLKGQYQDKQMQTELNKPENRREISNRLVTEKTLERLKSYATAKA
jgi:trigger factor